MLINKVESISISNSVSKLWLWFSSSEEVVEFEKYFLSGSVYSLLLFDSLLEVLPE